MHAAQLDQVVLELLEDQSIDVALGLVPVGLLAGLEGDQLDRQPGCLGTGECFDSPGRQLLLLEPREGVLELVVRNVFQLTACPSSRVENAWPSPGAPGRKRRKAPTSSVPSGWRSFKRYRAGLAAARESSMFSISQ